MINYHGNRDHNGLLSGPVHPHYRRNGNMFVVLIGIWLYPSYGSYHVPGKLKHAGRARHYAELCK